MIDVVMACDNLGATIQACEALFKNTTEPFNLTVLDETGEGSLVEEYIESLISESGACAITHQKVDAGSAWRQYPDVVEATNGEFIFFVGTNLVEPGWCDAPMAVMKENPNVGLIGLKHIHPRTGAIQAAGVEIGSGTVFTTGMGEPGHSRNYISIVTAVTGAILIRRKAIGINLSSYHTSGGWTDIDMCLETAKVGWDIVYCGQSACYSSARAAGADWGLWGKNKDVFQKKWGDLINKPLKK